MTMARPAVPRELTHANLDFSMKLYNHLASASDDNIFYSPIGISIAFALIRLGAKENTAFELEQVLGLCGVKDLDEAFKNLNDAINNNINKSELHLANRLFGRNDFQFLQDYLDRSLKFYRAELQSLDFRGDPEGSRKVINDWVESKTANKIKDLIPGGVINGRTALILVNAIYFKGRWLNKFEPNATITADFHVSENHKVDADFMINEHMYPVAFDQNLKASVVEVSYSDDNLSMFFFVPDEKFALKQLQEKLTVEKMKELLSSTSHPVEIELKLPKFKLEQTIHLHDILPELGLKDMFTMGRADLSAVTGSPPGDLYVSRAIHKAFVEVNEEGTEAAAATAAIMEDGMPTEITLDHPFLFAIVDRNTSTILFMGRLSNPNK